MRKQEKKLHELQNKVSCIEIETETLKSLRPIQNSWIPRERQNAATLWLRTHEARLADHEQETSPAHSESRHRRKKGAKIRMNPKGPLWAKWKLAGARSEATRRLVRDVQVALANLEEDKVRDIS